MSKSVLWIAPALVVVVGFISWKVAPSEKVIYKEPQKAVGVCEDNNSKYPIGQRVLVIRGYYGNIEGEVVGHADDAWCGQVVRIEYKGGWHTVIVKEDNLAKVDKP